MVAGRKRRQRRSCSRGQRCALRGGDLPFRLPAGDYRAVMLPTDRRSYRARMGTRRIPLHAIQSRRARPCATVGAEIVRRPAAARSTRCDRAGPGPHQCTGVRHAAGAARRGGDGAGERVRRELQRHRRRRSARAELPDDSRGRPRQRKRAASDRPDWGNETDPRVTLVGKGVCFDSGGLDIKPSTGMRS